MLPCSAGVPLRVCLTVSQSCPVKFTIQFAAASSLAAIAAVTATSQAQTGHKQNI